MSKDIEAIVLSPPAYRDGLLVAMDSQDTQRPPGYRPSGDRCFNDGDWFWVSLRSSGIGEAFWLYDPLPPEALTAREALQKIAGRMH